MRPHLPTSYHNLLLLLLYYFNIYYYYIIYYILYFIILTIHNFSKHNCKLPEDGVLTPKHVAVTLI